VWRVRYSLGVLFVVYAIATWSCYWLYLWSEMRRAEYGLKEKRAAFDVGMSSAKDICYASERLLMAEINLARLTMDKSARKRAQDAHLSRLRKLETSITGQIPLTLFGTEQARNEAIREAAIVTQFRVEAEAREVHGTCQPKQDRAR